MSNLFLFIGYVILITIFTISLSLIIEYFTYIFKDVKYIYNLGLEEHHKLKTINFLKKHGFFKNDKHENDFKENFKNSTKDKLDIDKEHIEDENINNIEELKNKQLQILNLPLF